MKKFICWFIFSILLTLLPLLLNYLLHRIFQKQISLDMLLAHGELLIIATALGARALGEVVSGEGRRGILLIFSGGGCVLVIILASMLFSCVSGVQIISCNIDITYVKTLSIIVYVFAVIVSSTSIIAVEV